MKQLRNRILSMFVEPADLDIPKSISFEFEDPFCGDDDDDDDFEDDDDDDDDD